MALRRNRRGQGVGLSPCPGWACARSGSRFPMCLGAVSWCKRVSGSANHRATLIPCRSRPAFTPVCSGTQRKAPLRCHGFLLCVHAPLFGRRGYAEVHHRSCIRLAARRPFRTAKRLCNVASIQPFGLLGVSASSLRAQGVRADCLGLGLPRCSFDDGPATRTLLAAGMAVGLWLAKPVSAISMGDINRGPVRYD